jgi:hypothetical protein
MFIRLHQGVFEHDCYQISSPFGEGSMTHSQLSSLSCGEYRMLLLSTVLSAITLEGWDVHKLPSLSDMSNLPSSLSGMILEPQDYESAFRPVGQHQ